MLFAFNFSGRVYASEINNELSYVVERVSNFLAKTGYLAVDSIMLSNPIVLNHSEFENSQNMYFVFDGDKIIGQILVSKIDEEFYSTFSYTTYNEIQHAYEQKIPVALFSVDKCLVAEVGGIIHVLKNAENSDTSSLIQQRYSLSEMLIEKVTPVELPAMSRSIYHFLKVAHVNNESSPQGIGLCWAACVASKIMYQTSYYNLTASSVFNKCWESVNNDPNKIPEGRDEWYSTAASLYGSSVTIGTALSSKTTTSNILSNGKPIILHIEGKDATHAVILCGVDEDASYMEFILMDPNEAGYVYLSLPNNIFNSPSQFYYGVGGVSYTRITRFIYRCNCILIIKIKV